MTEQTEAKATQTEKYKEFSHTFQDGFDEKEVTVACRFKRPSTQSANRAQKGMMKSPASAFSTLCLDAVHPDDKKKLQDAFNSWPGLASTFGGEILKSMGFGELGN